MNEVVVSGEETSMLEPAQALHTAISFLMRLLRWFVPSQAAIEAQAMNVRLSIVCGHATFGAGGEAQERHRIERRRLAMQLRIHDINVQETTDTRARGRKEFKDLAALPIEAKVTLWKFWLRRSMLDELRRRATRLVCLNETESECGLALQRYADACVASRGVLERGVASATPDIQTTVLATPHRLDTAVTIEQPSLASG